MKTNLPIHFLLLIPAVVLLFGTSTAHSRGAYGVSGNRGTAVATPRGVAWSGENSSGAVGRRGGAVATDNGVAARGRYGAVAAGDNGVAVASRQSVAVAGDNGVAVATRPIAPVAVTGAVYPRPLPAGYVRYVPNGSRIVVYRGYSCYFVGGVYYRAVMYEGTTVYIVVS
jgi:hypothetical protein